jgi:hypothetical protein
MILSYKYFYKHNFGDLCIRINSKRKEKMAKRKNRMKEQNERTRIYSNIDFNEIYFRQYFNS